MSLASVAAEAKLITLLLMKVAAVLEESSRGMEPVMVGSGHAGPTKMGICLGAERSGPQNRSEAVGARHGPHRETISTVKAVTIVANTAVRRHDGVRLAGASSGITAEGASTSAGPGGCESENCGV